MLKRLIAIALVAATPVLAGPPSAGPEPVGVFTTINHDACIARARRALDATGYDDIAADADHVRGVRQGRTATVECRSIGTSGQLITVAFPGDTRSPEEILPDRSALLQRMGPGN